MAHTTGLHHVTAICTTPSENVRFYREVLGLAFVKRTVNHDDPTTYHLYYGDQEASPGTLMTFFAWTQLPEGRRGTGEARTTEFSIPEASAQFWNKRLSAHGVQVHEQERFGEQRLVFEDPHGLELALVAADDETREPAYTDAVPAAHAIRGFRAVTLVVQEATETADLLEAMGYQRAGEQGSYLRMRNDHGEFPSFVDLDERPDLPRAQQGVGSVHHVAFRAGDEQQQQLLKDLVSARGLRETRVIDRAYFKSVYFREPAGVLFELATDGPGFGVDEDPQHLGESLVLPPWLEGRREEIQEALPELDV